MLPAVKEDPGSDRSDAEPRRRGDIMKTRFGFLLLASVVTGTILIPGQASATAAATKVTIQGPNGDFQGEIHSVKLKCLGNRTVKVYKQAGSTQAPSIDKVIASDTSERNGDHGDWSVGNTGYKKGKFYARATKTPICKPGSSPTIKL
jgi:hypothetical protein